MTIQGPAAEFIRTCADETEMAQRFASYKESMIVVMVALVWVAASVPLGLVLGCAISRADERALFTDHLTGLPADLTVADVVGARITEPSH